MCRLSTLGVVVFLVALSMVVTICLLGAADEGWGKCGIVILCFFMVTTAMVAIEDIIDRRRRCPRCEVQGFEVWQEGEKETPTGSDFYAVSGCEHCGLRQLVCGNEVMELDAELWDEELIAGLKREAGQNQGEDAARPASPRT